MHGNSNIKFIVAKQTKEIYQYNNTKRKLYRTNAAIWYKVESRWFFICILTYDARKLKHKIKNVLPRAPFRIQSKWTCWQYFVTFHSTHCTYY